MSRGGAAYSSAAQARTAPTEARTTNYLES
jgi:hypothetical protein